MMVKRKKTNFDGIDREILRVLYIQRPMVTRQIAISVGLSSSAVGLRLRNLENKGIVKIFGIYKMRCFERSFGNILLEVKSPRSIFWDLDLKP